MVFPHHKKPLTRVLPHLKKKKRGEVNDPGLPAPHQRVRKGSRGACRGGEGGSKTAEDAGA